MLGYPVNLLKVVIEFVDLPMKNMAIFRSYLCLAKGTLQLNIELWKSMVVSLGQLFTFMVDFLYVC